MKKQKLYTLKYSLRFESGIENHEIHGIVGFSVKENKNHPGYTHIELDYDDSYSCAGMSWDEIGEIISIGMVEE